MLISWAMFPHVHSVDMMDCGFLEFTKIRDSNLVLILDSSDSTKNNLNFRDLKRERNEIKKSFLSRFGSMTQWRVLYKTCI